MSMVIRWSAIFSHFDLFLLVVICNALLCRGTDYAYLTFEDVKKMDEYDKYIRAGAQFGAMKFLEFNGTKSLFVGGRNRIYRFEDNFSSLIPIKETSDTLPIWRFKPYYNKTFIPGIFKDMVTYVSFNATATIIGCLTYTERRRARYGGIEGLLRNLSYLTPGPGVRFKMPWIRFSEKFENYTCFNSTIRSFEKVKDSDGKDALWACGTFGSFPQSFLFDPVTLDLKKVGGDSSLPSCARWPDEPMAARMTDEGDLYIASGWGIYRPDKKTPDRPNNNSTMLYSDWNLLSSGFKWVTRMAMVLGRDVRFISRVVEDKNYIYFFGHETSPQLSIINRFTNEVAQSFMLRICKNDIGFNYTADEDWPEIEKQRGNITRYFGMFTDNHNYNSHMYKDYTKFSYSSKAYNDIFHLPTKHFVSALKIPFGCYLKRYDGAQSLNHFWGEQNIMYFSRVADIEWKSNDSYVDEFTPYVHDDIYEEFVSPFPMYLRLNYIDYKTASNPNADTWQTMYGAFSSPGQKQRRKWRRNSRQRSMRSAAQAHGAICQFQVTEWKSDFVHNRSIPSAYFIDPQNLTDGVREYFKDYLSISPKNKRQFLRLIHENKFLREFFDDRLISNGLFTINRFYEEFLAYYGSQQSDFYSRFSLWFQGAQVPGYEGLDLHAMYNFTNKEMPLWDAADAGQCMSEAAMRNMTKAQFLRRMKFASMAWPTEWDSWASKGLDSVFHMNPVQVAGDNASFIAKGVEFAKMFVLAKNKTDYKNGNQTKPLVYLLLVTTEGEVYRVVMCDIVSIPIKKCDCEMTNTDQPYITKYFQYMRGATWLGSVMYTSTRRFYPKNYTAREYYRQIRVSSLLSVWRFTNDEDERVYPHDEDWQAPLLKDAQLEHNILYLTTAERIMKMSTDPKDVCKSYRTCVHCASDPFCMWVGKSTAKASCQLYDAGQAEGLQDVLRRGEKCSELLSTPVQLKKMWLQPDLGLRLSCKDWGFFRGIYAWEIDNKTIDMDNSLNQRLYRVNSFSHSLILRPPAKQFKKSKMIVECVGTSIDDEKAKTKLITYEVTINSSHKCDECSRLNKNNNQFAGAQYCVEQGFCSRPEN